jgi:hypothetical protein
MRAKETARGCRWQALLTFAFVVGLLASGPASAQTAGGHALTSPEQQLAAGSGVGVTYVTQWSPLGFGVDVSKKLMTIWSVRTLNAVAELTMTRAKTHHDTNVVAGVRYVRHTKDRPTVFAQFLGGLNHESREDSGRNDLRLQPGGGVDFPIGRNFLIRAQNDYPLVFTHTRTILYLRFSFGVEMHFK